MTWKPSHSCLRSLDYTVTRCLAMPSKDSKAKMGGSRRI
ncbi:unnamed protein product [Brassica oleracea var. botrytis]